MKNDLVPASLSLNKLQEELSRNQFQLHVKNNE